jgi:molybdopterin-guanine dinucleotide biosynthesis protein A
MNQGTNKVSVANISCIILAGGRGRRVEGRDKGLIDYKNKKLIEHLIDALKPQVNEIIINANRNLDDYRQYGYPVISDDNKNFLGPLAGIDAALSHCQNEWVFITPCDMPLLPADIVSRLYQAVTTSALCMAETGGQLQPVFLMNRKLHGSITESLQKGQLKLLYWAKSQSPSILTFSRLEDFSNFNFSSDF